MTASLHSQMPKFNAITGGTRAEHESQDGADAQGLWAIAC